MNAKTVLLTLLCTPLLALGQERKEPGKISGDWEVEVKFESGASHSLRYQARESGKGAFQLQDPRSRVWGMAGPSGEGKWSQDGNGATLFAGPVEFPLGNVGRDTGTLVLRGKLGADGAIAGTASFFPPGEDPNDPQAKPSKNGSFRATRLTGG